MSEPSIDACQGIVRAQGGQKGPPLRLWRGFFAHCPFHPEDQHHHHHHHHHFTIHDRFASRKTPTCGRMKPKKRHTNTHKSDLVCAESKACVAGHCGGHVKDRVIRGIFEARVHRRHQARHSEERETPKAGQERARVYVVVCALR